MDLMARTVQVYTNLPEAFEYNEDIFFSGMRTSDEAWPYILCPGNKAPCME